MRTAQTTDSRLEALVGHILRIGVSVAAALVLGGAILFLLRHGGDAPRYGSFQPLAANRPSLAEVLGGIGAGRGRSLVQAGLLILIATPISRVLFSLWVFAEKRDWIYTGVTAVVAAVLAFSLLAG
jgi:uncharacterized membrane protein